MSWQPYVIVHRTDGRLTVHRARRRGRFAVAGVASDVPVPECGTRWGDASARFASADEAGRTLSDHEDARTCGACRPSSVTPTG